MTLTHGLDPAKVRDIATRMMATSRKLDDVSSEGTATVQALGEAWEGPDLVEFSGHWNHYRGTIDQTTESISRFADLLNEQVRQQEETSGAGGGVVSGPGSGPASGTTPGGAGRGPWGPLMDFLGGAQFWGGLAAKISTIASKAGVLLSALRYPGLLRAADAAGDLRAWMQASWAANRAGFSMLKGLLTGEQIAARLGVPLSYVDELGRSGRLSGLLSRVPFLGGAASAAGNLMSKVFGPIGILTGGLDVWNGLQNGDYLKAFGGAAGLTSGLLTTGIAFGLIAGGPITVGIAAGAAIVSAGVAIYQNWDAISSGITQAAGAVVDFGESVVDGVGSFMSDPIGAIGGLFG